MYIALIEQLLLIKLSYFNNIDFIQQLLLSVLNIMCINKRSIPSLYLLSYKKYIEFKHPE